MQTKQKGPVLASPAMMCLLYLAGVELDLVFVYFLEGLPIITCCWLLHLALMFLILTLTAAHTLNQSQVTVKLFSAVFLADGKLVLVTAD